MSDRDMTQHDDLTLILEELLEAKASLKQISQQFVRVERRLKAALPSTKVKAVSRLAQPNLRSSKEAVDQLLEMAGRGIEIESQLREMAIKPELQRIASELGLTNDKLPPKDELVRRIASRVRQSASLAAGFRKVGSSG